MYNKLQRFHRVGIGRGRKLQNLNKPSEELKKKQKKKIVINMFGHSFTANQTENSLINTIIGDNITILM